MPKVQLTQIERNNRDRKKKEDEKEKPEKPISSMIGKSKRLTLTYIILIIWIGLGVFGIIQETDLYGLAVYFASGLPLILGYMWSETSRPSLKDASQILKYISPNRRNNNMGGFNNMGGYGGYNGGGNNVGMGGYRNQNQYNDIDSDVNSNVNNNAQNIQISIFSDDSSVELKPNEAQLETLINTGYVDPVGDKYTFKKEMTNQVKSLINGEEEEPEI